MARGIWVLLLAICVAGGCGKAKPKPATATTTAVNSFYPTTLQDMAKSLAAAVKANGQNSPAGTPLLVLSNVNSAFWAAPGIGVSRAGAELGVPASFQLTATPKLPQTAAGSQATLLNQALAEGSLYKGIALSVAADSANTISTIMQNEETSPVSPPAVPFVTIDSDVASGFYGNRVLYLGTDNVNSGTAAGKQILKMLPNGGSIYIITTFSSSAANASGRIQGITGALAGSNVTIAGTLYTNNSSPVTTTGCTAAQGNCCVSSATAALNTLCSITDTQAVLANNPALIVAINTTSSLNAALGLVASNKVGQVKMLAYDSSPANLTNLANGTVQGLVVQRGYWEGYLAVYVLYANAVLGSQATLGVLKPLLYSSDTFGPNLIDTGTDIVTSDNLAEYQSYLESINIQSD